MPHDNEMRLQELNDTLVKMSVLVGTAISLATRALLEDDLALAEQVMSGDAQLNGLNADVESLCFKISTLQAPMARDLRMVIGAIRMASSLERMGDLAVHIAKQVRLRYPNPSIPRDLIEIFTEMGQAANSIVEEIGQVIATGDPALASKIAQHDDVLDRLHRELFTAVLAPTWAHGVEAAIDVTLLSRYFERFGDHAVTVAKRITHIAVGPTFAE